MKTFAFLVVHSLAQEQTCKDWELEEKCLDQCRLIYTDCTQNCSDNTCQTQCVNRYSACMADCPCNLNCPNGCDGCDHPLCNVCDAESNMHSQQCKNEAVQKESLCKKSCEMTDDDCYSQCHLELMNDKMECPCMDNCPNGCPCDSFKCQPYVSVIGEYYHYKESYVISTDGSFRENRHYDSPPEKASSQYGYFDRIGHEIFQGDIFFFGGRSDELKIAKLDGCEVVELDVRLLFPYDCYYGSSTANEEEIFICFSESPYRYCEGFDGNQMREISCTTEYSHQKGCMAYYNDDVYAIGGTRSNEPTHGNVEILGYSGWTLGVPMNEESGSHGHECLPVSNGILLFGGNAESPDYDWERAVHFFTGTNWSVVGFLNEPQRYPSGAVIGNYVFVVSGRKKPYAIERLEWTGSNITSSEIIHNHIDNLNRPMVWEGNPTLCEAECN
ncbi:Oidioi.mRNA.OKI2018_I69.chr2.g8056.t1.cds [Oikopleura dioica]|uniref:Oidioi.mRNA.OKI2018_I69.chr2.g8056.t1.cds n=1 Tax=Oikopleura dioica TaxID=34765 RepID=A0ABN7TED3_OIKDI|nr:Oidioi.mRNA.OKI2018_I69.chr2.g8056.t1.cds [Oikopleura dioica]